jgi:hypothetical protein
MSGIYNYVFGQVYDFDPTSVLRHQKHLVLKQLLSSKLKLKSVSEELRLIKEKELDFITLIKERKKTRRQGFIKNTSGKF